MISVSQAQTLVKQTSRRLIKTQNLIEKIPLASALGRFVAKPLTARFDVPRFDNSAMDGFAVRGLDTREATKENPVSLKIVGTIAAGDSVQDQGGRMESGKAMRIMTGAPIPSGADTVVKKEDITERKRNLLLYNAAEQGQNIRRRGEDIRSGQRAATAGTRITPGVAAFLASVGIETIPVFRTPRVSIIVTGNELIGGGNNKIPDSNSLFLSLALKEMRLTPQRIQTVTDNPDTLKKIFEKSLNDSDLVIVTGGVSVGERDYTKEALGRSGVRTVFWKVAQKPGKPFFFGKHRRSLVFGLPGNPYAVVVCFTLYIRPALFLLMGAKRGKDFSGTARLDHDFVKSDNKSYFLKGAVVSQNGDLRVIPLRKQGSHLLSTMTKTDLLIEIPAEALRIRGGEKVRVHFL